MIFSIKQKYLSFRPMLTVSRGIQGLSSGASQMNNITYVKGPKWLLQFPVVLHKVMGGDMAVKSRKNR